MTRESQRNLSCQHALMMMMKDEKNILTCPFWLHSLQASQRKMKRESQSEKILTRRGKEKSDMWSQKNPSHFIAGITILC